MLGFSAAVNRLLPAASPSDLEHVRGMPYGAGADYALQLRGDIVVAYFATTGAGVMDLVKRAESGPTMLVHDGGYPYIVVGSALEFRNALTGIGVEVPIEIADSDSLMLVAWDQS